MTNLNNLLTFVRAHAHKAWVADGAVYADAIYSLRDGGSETVVERVGATMAECRDWLGY